ncbi:MAG: glycine cleavage system protein R [Gammaproteobacteria bacterium]
MEQLTLLVLGKNKIGLLHVVSQFIHHNDCSIQISRIMTLGQDFACYCLVTGNWHALAKLEAHLPTFEKQHQLKCLSQRTLETKHEKTLPYTSYILAVNKPNVINQIIHFFMKQDIQVNEFSSNLYQARHSNVLMCEVTLSLSLAEDISLSDLREQFILFCDNHNLDGILEPDKS